MTFVQIYDNKKRNEIIEENLRLRKKLKHKSEDQQNLKNEIDNNHIELFKPLIESNEKTQNELIEDRDKIIDTFNKLSFNVVKQSPIENKKDASISDLIVRYLKGTSNRSNAGYSIRFYNKSNCYAIGNQEIIIHQNNLIINDKTYNATDGLTELLIKNSPDITLITDADRFYA